MAIVPPVIVVPGFSGTYLRDEYNLPPDPVWSKLVKEYERAALHPENLRYDLLGPSRVRSDYIFEVAYQELIAELRHNLADTADRPVPVYPFAYDWRQPLETLEVQLANFVFEVVERTKLLQHYHDAGYAAQGQVNLVGHSMGGLLIAGYLERYGRAARVNKVVTLASPFRGSFEAVVHLTTGTAAIGAPDPSSRERETARLTPAIYQFLPSTRGVEVDAGLPDSIFDPGLWQPSIVQTLAEYLRLHAVDKQNLPERAAQLFAGLLNGGRVHRDRLENFRLDKAGLTPADWLAVVGVHANTRVRLRVLKTAGGPAFDFHSTDFADNWGSADPAQARLTGDGTVPFEGAVPAFLDESNLVCVTADDFGYWEVGDKLLMSVGGGLHPIMPNMDMLHRLIVRFFKEQPDQYGNTWGRPAPGVAHWQPPLALRNKDAG